MAVEKKETPQLIITGKQAIDGDNSQTGQMLAALTGYPQATFASEVDLGDDSATVVREVDGGLETITVKLPAVITTDLRLNEPRYASLPNIMKAKKKPIDTMTPEDLGVDVAPRVNTLKVTPPAERQAGIIVETVEELFDKLKNEAKDLMTILVIADHDNSAIAASTRVTIAAAKAIGGDIEVLVAGADCAAAGEAAAKIDGVSKVRVADNAAYANQLAENIGDLVAEIGKDYSHILTSTSTVGKNFMPRVAALLDVAQISDISGVVSEDTFERPIYAGNAIATVQSTDSIKVITVRGTAFDAVAEEGGSAAVEAVDVTKDSGLSTWVKADIVELISLS